MGMLAAIECARLIGYFATAPKRVMMLENYTSALLATVTGLPLWTRQIAIDELMDRFSADKKHTETHYVVILPDSTGHLIRLELEKSDPNRSMIFEAFRSVCQRASVSD